MDVFLKKCTTEDFEQYYTLKIDKNNIFWAGFKNPPNKEKLKIWFNRQLKRKERIIFLVKSIEYPNEALGYLYIDFNIENKDIVATGHGVHSTFSGKGIGTKIIGLAVEYSEKYLKFINQLVGWVAIDNIGSIKNFLRNGYTETNETKSVYLKDFEKEIVMKKYIKPIYH